MSFVRKPDEVSRMRQGTVLFLAQQCQRASRCGAVLALSGRRKPADPRVDGCISLSVIRGVELKTLPAELKLDSLEASTPI